MELNFVQNVAERAVAGRPPARAELEALLSLKDREAAEPLFAGARRVREAFFGAKVFFYGFVYLSTFCRNDCAFCGFRAGRAELERYRKSPEEIVEAAVDLADSGVHLIDLTLGEDPAFHAPQGFDELCRLIGEVKAATGLPVMLSPGRLDRAQLARAKAAGASWYACYQETHNRRLFAQWRRGQDYDRRLDSKREARREGLLIEEGVLVGAGASPADLADSVAAMAELGAQQVRAMGYVPPPGGLAPPAGLDAVFEELLTMAVLRLSRPQALIPASLDVEGLAGLDPRLAAGANVVTSLVPRGRGLAGVAGAELDIENGARGAPAVTARLAAHGLAAAEREEYLACLERLSAGPATGGA
ncbi:MAG: methylornithine synthase PylB [Deltaproteobacteria bacterium]|jgi:methylornithine synthase|nr:methylornithine synthase PylB [Deltaproteobacteria bacterium]